VNNKYDCLKLHHVGCLIKQIDDAQNHKYQIYGIISRTLKRKGGGRGAEEINLKFYKKLLILTDFSKYQLSVQFF